MITQMKKYTFLVFHRDYEPFLTQLRDLGVVDITLKSAGDIENDEQLQAALQHEDELRRLIAQGAPDQLLAERANIEQSIADAQTAAQQAAVWGDFDATRIQELKDAGYTLRFYSCPTSAFREEWGIVINIKEGKTYFVQVDNPTSQDIDSEMLEKVTEIPAPEKSEAQWNQEVENLNRLLAAANARIEAWTVLRHGNWRTWSVCRRNSPKHVKTLIGSVLRSQQINSQKVRYASFRVSVRLTKKQN